MLPEPPPPILGELCERLVEIYLSQTEEGRAAILSFLHTSVEADKIKARFRIRRSGQVTLFLETVGTMHD